MASDAVSWALVLMSFFIFLRASRPAPDTGQDSVLRYSTVIAPASVAFTVFLVTLPSAYSAHMPSQRCRWQPLPQSSRHGQQRSNRRDLLP